MNLKASILVVLLFAFALSLIDARRGFSLFGKKRRHKSHKASNPQPEPKPEATPDPAPVLTTSSSLEPTPTTTSSSIIPTIPNPTTSKTEIIPTTTSSSSSSTSTKPTHTKTYHEAANLRLVYQTVLPTGLTRSNRNVVFEYADEEANKTCRCICRMKDAL